MRLSLARTFIRKDWHEFRKPIAVLTLGLLAPVAMLWSGLTRPDFAKGMLGGLLLAGPFLYAQSCFYSERQHGTLGFLLALPMTRFEFVLAKYASLFSMTLFTVNTPGILLGDPKFLFHANAAALFLASLFMAATVVSNKPWAAQLPFWLIIVVAMPAEPLLKKFYPRGLDAVTWIGTHHTAIAVAAYLLTVLIALGSAWVFKNFSCGTDDCI